MTPEIHPATAARWNDVVAVIGNCAVANRCWCAYWYLSNADFKAGWGEGNRLPLEARVLGGEEPGIIAYVEGEPAAWVSVAPRTDFDRLNRSRNFAPIDDAPVWAVNCFVVARRFRRQSPGGEPGLWGASEGALKRGGVTGRRPAQAR